MKKILFLNSCVEWGGGEKWTFETALELDKRGYEVIVASVEESELYQKAEKHGLKTKVVPVRGSLSALNPFKMWSFVHYLQEEQITTMFLNLSQDLKFGAWAADLAGLEQIIYRRGSAIPIKDRFYTKFLLEDCVTDIIANSKSTKETILENTKEWLSAEKIEIIYNGIQVEQIEEAAIKTDIRQEFDLADSTTLIANVGRLSEQKGHCYLIEAVQLLAQERDDFKVLVVGKGELEEEIKAQVKKLGLEDHIIFTGFRTDVYSIMKQIDFLLHTALWEGFGFVVAEAMAAGKPVVSTDVSNISEIIVEGETGYLDETKNPEDIAEKTIKLLENDSREQMGQVGRQVVKDKFSFEEQVDKLANYYLV
jgi:glycosyltransferase involved in cell wall biosynthesis